MSASDGSGVKSAERALSILELFSQRDRALTFTQVGELLGYPRSSLHGLLRTLTERGWLRLDPATRRFSLGLRAWEAGNAYRPAVDLAERATPVVQRLHQQFRGTVHLSVLDGEHSVAIARSGDGLDIRTPAHASGTGRVLLADLGRRERERALAAGHDGIDAEELHRGLDRVRLDGWESDDGEGMRTLAVPVRDVRGTVVAALGVAAPAPDLAPERRDEALRALRQGAEQIASELPSV